MLTGDLLRARVTRGSVEPRLVDPDVSDLVATAAELIAIHAAHLGHERGELKAALEDRAQAGDRLRFERGLAKLLEDRATFERRSLLDPEATRAVVFEAAARARAAGSFDRGAVLAAAAITLAGADRAAPAAPEDAGAAGSEVAPEGARAAGNDAAATPAPGPLASALTADDVEASLEADRKSHERLLAVEPIEPRALLVRYNVALCQAILLRATHVRLDLEAKPARLRHVLRAVKFRRLLFRASSGDEPGASVPEPSTTGRATRARRAPKQSGRALGSRLRLDLDGPLALFEASTKYGLELATVLPVVLLCERFELSADLAWGPRRVPKTFTLSDRDLRGGMRSWLRSHIEDPGAAPPPELEAFKTRFETIAPGWRAEWASDVVLIGEGEEQDALVPDLRFTHEATGKVGWLEVLTSARRGTVPRRLELLARHGPPGLVVAVARNLLPEGTQPPCVVPFRSMPSAKDVLEALAAGLGLAAAAS